MRRCFNKNWATQHILTLKILINKQLQLEVLLSILLNVLEKIMLKRFMSLNRKCRPNHIADQFEFCLSFGHGIKNIHRSVNHIHKNCCSCESSYWQDLIH